MDFLCVQFHSTIKQNKIIFDFMLYIQTDINGPIE